MKALVEIGREIELRHVGVDPASGPDRTIYSCCECCLPCQDKAEIERHFREVHWGEADRLLREKTAEGGGITIQVKKGGDE